MQIELSSFKLVLLLFWALWFTLVLLNNSFEGLKKAGVLPDSWKFASDNYAEIEKSLSTYRPPGWLAGLLFSGVVLWKVICVLDSHPGRGFGRGVVLHQRKEAGVQIFSTGNWISVVDSFKSS